MKKTKIRAKPAKIPSPFGTTVFKTERTAVAILMHWMREIIENKNIDLGMPDVETYGDDRKLPDVVIYETQRSQNILCVIEAKPPYFDVFDEEELKIPAKEKANKRKAKYFATTNFKRLIWFNTEKVNSMKPEEEQIIEKYSLSEMENLDDIEQTRYCVPIKRGLGDFLTKIYSVHSGKEPEPKQAIDEFLIFRLQEKIRVLANYYRSIIDDRCHKDTSFTKKLTNWFVDQGWSFAWQPPDFDKAARQTAYLLVNKIIFYDLLQAKRPQELAPLEIPAGLIRGSQLKKILQSFFDEILKIDYETIYTTDFIDSIAFPESKEVLKEVKELVDVLRRYDFSKLGYDVIGRIFERLIPQAERHNLGQYFTSPDIVDLILKFCIHHEDDKILDPGCGAGTFLVRAYQHKKLMNLRKSHEEILNTLWGNDIAKFPAHLATINLAINDLAVEKNYPNILQEDFFTLLVGEEGFYPEKWRKTRAKTLRLEEREVTYPRWFDAVVGNPPYTRQEEISEISPEDAEYKKNLIKNALLDLRGNKIADIGKRAGIHAYFFVHGTKFLKDGAHFGFIVSNSWLDVDYGKGLQEFFLKNYKIIAIIESKVERWFEEADINTCIVILQKCKDEKNRNGNPVRFVYLKNPLRHFIPPAQDMWEKQIERIDSIDKLRKTIIAHNDFYENEELRIYPKSQKELWVEGFDSDNRKYVGAKWGKYLRAPEPIVKKVLMNTNMCTFYIFAEQIMEGEPTGANNFFFLSDDTVKKFGIEKQFIRAAINSPRDAKSVRLSVENSKSVKLVVNLPKDNLKGKNVFKYIEWGERMGFKKHYFKKDIWYSRSDRKADVLIPRGIYQRFVCFNNIQELVASDRFVEIFLKSNKKFRDQISALLNSTCYILMLELFCRTNLGQGVLDIQPTDIRKIPLPDLNILSKELTAKLGKTVTRISKDEVGSIFEELGASSPEEVSLNKVKPVRRELDKIVMGEILGLTEDEQLEVYRAVIDLVKSRIEKAKSFGKKKKTREGIDVDALVKIVMEKIGKETIGNCYRKRILKLKPLMTKTILKLSGGVRIDKDFFGWKVYSGKKYIECNSEEEARYFKVFIEAGFEKIKVPKDNKDLYKILPFLEELKAKIDEIINSYLESISSTKTRERIKHQLWSEIIK